MKQQHLIAIIAMAATTMLTSCISDESGLTLDKGQGTLNLTLGTDNAFQTRAVNEQSYTNTDNYDVRIVKTGQEDKPALECKGSELPSKMPLTLEIGTYRIEATYGTEHAASRDDFKMLGSTTISIKGGEAESASVHCTPTCGKVTVEFAPEMATYFDEYNVVFGGTKLLGTNTFKWEKTDTDPWYVGLDGIGETITYTINLTPKNNYILKGDGQSTAITRTFKLERNKGRKLQIAPSYTETGTTGANITITIDDGTNDKPVDIEIPVDWI